MPTRGPYGICMGQPIWSPYGIWLGQPILIPYGIWRTSPYGARTWFDWARLRTWYLVHQCPLKRLRLRSTPILVLFPREELPFRFLSLWLPSGLPPVSSIWIPWLSLTFSVHFSLTFPDLTTQIWWVSHEIPSEERKNFAPATTGFLQKKNA